MRKAIFLEYKFGDYDTKTLYSSGANEIVAWMERLNDKRLKQLKNWGVKISLCISAFRDEVCPFDPSAKNRLSDLLKQAVDYQPNSIILDHFRFRGKWEQSGKKLKYVLAHKPCHYCRGVEKGEKLAEIAAWIKEEIPMRLELGYYAVPLKYEEFPQFGQNHALLVKAFDYSSPMLYHQMLDKPVQYISQFTKYLFDLASKPVIPAIAVKDMPDNLPDKIDESILKEEYSQAVKSPSAGVCWFSWDGAVEKKKTQIIAKMWNDE
ncbi:MAG: hypothetical protein G01um101416_97 [Microgenomates group bacterium Gr01-1014_16]|nr:MAG: hypothetical protein G01um101416_97 [Microgenomates group bacterium Gr01-1014_16]